MKYKKVLIGVLVTGFLSLYFFYNPLHAKLVTTCPLHATMGIHCPGCGSIRAADDLIHLRVLDALSHNALLILSLFVGLSIFIYSKKKFYRLVNHPKSIYVAIGIISLFWILRNLDIAPFHYLAP